MILATKIKLKPTKEQEVLFWKSAGVARWSYNYFIAESNKHYDEYDDYDEEDCGDGGCCEFCGEPYSDGCGCGELDFD